MRLICFAIALTISVLSYAQEQSPIRVSPLDMVTAKYKDTYFKITYSRPSMKERKIFGGLVPFGEVWRTGANEATELTLTRDILLNQKTIKAGTYSLFTIPDSDKWTIIINAETGLWGAYNYNPKADVLRFDVPVTKTDSPTELLTMKIQQRNEMVDLIISWETTQISIPAKFNN